MMQKGTKDLSEEEKARRVEHFKKIIKYRGIFGWFFSLVGISLCAVGWKNLQNLMVLINGFLFFGYGLFMVWQSKRAKENLDKQT